MTTASVMSKDLFTVNLDETIANALSIMYKNKIHNLPVVDEHGCFVGMFGIRHIILSLLPNATTVKGFELENLNFLPDDALGLIEDMHEVGKQPVKNFLKEEKNLQLCGPDTAFPELLRLLYTSDSSLPVMVTDGEEKKLVGMVSNWDILSKIAQELATSKEEK